MRETSFIKQNQEKWKRYEHVLNQDNPDPDELNDLFIQVTDDLSYSRTFYPNRSVRVYLNNIAQQIFYSIYKNKKTKLGRLAYFWTHDLPHMVYQSKNEFRLAFWVFMISFAIGMLSCAMDSEFLRVVLGDDYVDMTLENIESGDPMAVYKQKGEFGMSLGITINNIWVAFQTFALGIFFAIGTFFFLIKNAVMVGAFQYFFYEQGVFQESFLTIWIHGTLEISAIIIAGAAGITMGKGLAFPGTLTRLQAFQLSARRGIKIMLGIVPIFIIAGFIEGYLTRHTETPDLIRFLFILICLAFVLMYFVWLPVKRGREGLEVKKLSEGRLPPTGNRKIDFSRIKTSGELFSDSFIFYGKYLKELGGVAFLGSIFYGLFNFNLTSDLPNEIFKFPAQAFGTLSVVDQFFLNESLPFLFFINTLVFSALTFMSYTLMVRESNDGMVAFEKGNGSVYYLLNFLKVLFVVALMNLIIWYQAWFTFLAIPFLVPVLMLWGYVMFKENIGILSGMQRTIFLLSGAFGKLIGVFMLLLSIGFLFFLITDTSLIWFYIQFVSMNLALEQDSMNQFTIVSLTFIAMLVLYLIYPLITNGIGLLYSSLLEIQEAPDLKERIQNIGQTKMVQGMVKES